MTPQQLLHLIVQQLAQLSILILAAELATKFFCRRRPHLAYAFWLLVLVKSVTPPIWSSPTSIFSWVGAENGQMLDQPLQPAAATPNTAGLIATEPVSRRMISPGVRQFQLPQLVLGVWATGCAGLILAVGIRWFFLRRRIVQSAVQPPRELTDMLEDLRRCLGIRRRTRLLLCKEPLGPAVIGIFRPVLVLPMTMLQEKTIRQVRPVLAHEIIHLRRNDPLVAGLQFFSQAIWWFHPLAWWMNRQISRIREICCDAEVIASLQCRPVDYAQVLLDVARSRRTFRQIVPSLGIRPADVTRRRLNHIMTGTGWSHRRMPWRYWAVVAIGASLLLPSAGISGGVTSAPSAEDKPIPSSRPSQLTHIRHFVMLVADIDGITFQGQPTILDKLPALLKRVPDRAHTVLQLGYASGDVTMRQFNEVQTRAGRLVTQLGFEYLSYTGQHPADSKGSPDKVIFSVAEQPLTPLPSLPPAPVSELTHIIDFQRGLTLFYPGDIITITEVRGTADHFEVDGTYQVKGIYTLASRDHATLAVSVAAKNPRDALEYWGKKQSITIARGSGTFTLTERMSCEGSPHISFYDENSSIGDVYFDAGSWISR
jgi:beta-lactamase regulating signal transducer with metallopeptidase domain